MGSDGKWGYEASIYTPKKGGIFNALNSVALSVPRERPLIILKDRNEKWELMQTWDDETQTEFRCIKKRQRTKFRGTPSPP